MEHRIYISTMRHVKDGKVSTPWVYIGRENKCYDVKRSPLANPYPLEAETKEAREACYAKYLRYLWLLMKENAPDVMAELQRICDLLLASR